MQPTRGQLLVFVGVQSNQHSIIRVPNRGVRNSFSQPIILCLGLNIHLPLSRGSVLRLIIIVDNERCTRDAVK